MSLTISDSVATLSVQSIAEVPARFRALVKERLADPGDLEADGVWRSFQTLGDLDSAKPGRKAGFCAIDLARMICVYGSHRPGECPSTVVEIEVTGPQPSQAEREEAANQAREHRAQTAQEAQQRAREVWASGELDLADHAYLQARGVLEWARPVAGRCVRRFAASNALLVPMMDAAGDLWNRQAIAADGRKRFLPGGRIEGLALWVPAPPASGARWYATEGFAKALAVSGATGCSCLCCFTANNLTAAIQEHAAAILSQGIIAADPDQAGRTAVAEAQARFPQLRVIYPPDGAGDWNDLLVGRGLDALKAALAADPVKVEGPQPLMRPVDAGEEYPVDRLGAFAPMIRRIAEVAAVDPALVAQSFLGAVSVATQGLGDLLIDGRCCPSSLYLLTVAGSGERKTTIDRLLLAEHRRWQKERLDGRDAALLDSQFSREAHAVAKAGILRDAKRGGDAKAALQALGPEPSDPPTEVLLLEDVSLEGMVKLLINNRPSCGVISDEGGRLLNGWSLSQEHATRTISGYSSLWDGSPLVTVRAGAGLTALYGRRITLHWQAQPGVAQLIFGNPQFADQGFLWRCLVAEPSVSKPAEYNPVDLTADPLVVAYYRRIRELLEKPLPLAIRETGPALELDPPKLVLSRAAKACWIEHYNHIESLAQSGGPLFPIRGYARKCAELIGRIACGLTLLSTPDATVIADDVIENAAVLMLDYYLNEMLRHFEGLQVGKEVVLAQRLLEWTRTREFVYPSQVYQFGPYCIRTRDQATKAISVLESHGWLVRVPGGMELDGQKRRDVWRVIREEVTP
jgi:hypothetical protein